MKKINIVLYVTLILLLTACNNVETKGKSEDNKEIITICAGEQNIKENVIAKTKYEITSVDDDAKELLSSETIESDDEEYLKSIKTSIENSFSTYNNIKYYKYNVEIENNKLISTIEIKYDKIDIDKLISIDQANKNIIKDKKVSLNLLKNMYESLGNTCIKK